MERAEHDGIAQFVHRGVGEQAGPVGVGAEQEHRELVAAEAGDQVLAAAHASTEAIRHRPQQHVARLVTHGVVHDLEVVEVEEHDHGQLVVLERLVEPRQELGAVRQARQLVVIGAVAEPALQLAGLGDVAEREHHTGHGHVGGQVHRGQVHQSLAAVGMTDDRLDGSWWPRVGKTADALDRRPPRLLARGHRQIVDRPAEPVIGFVAEHGVHRTTGVGDLAALVDEHHHVGRPLHQRGEGGPCRDVR